MCAIDHHVAAFKSSTRMFSFVTLHLISGQPHQRVCRSGSGLDLPLLLLRRDRGQRIQQQEALRGAVQDGAAQSVHQDPDVYKNVSEKEEVSWCFDSVCSSQFSL